MGVRALTSSTAQTQTAFHMMGTPGGEACCEAVPAVCVFVIVCEGQTLISY